MTTSKSIPILGGLLIAGVSFLLIVGAMAWLMPHFIVFSQTLWAKLILLLVFPLTVIAFWLAGRRRQALRGRP